MRKTTALLLVAMLLTSVALARGMASATTPQLGAAADAAQYIEGLQNADGGFPSFGTDSTPGSTIDAVFALKAAGIDPATVTNSGHSPIDYLESQAQTYALDAGGTVKLLLCVRLVGRDILSFGGVNFPGAIDPHYDDGSGRYGDDNIDQALFILAAEKFQPIPEATRPGSTALRLYSLQQPDGGWEFAAGQGSDSNTTALVIQAFEGRDYGVGSETVRNALSYLHGLQNADGGFGFNAGSDSDPNSTALVIQALVAVGENIDAGGPWSQGGHTPMDALLSFRNAATGAFQYGGMDNAYATYQAVPALMLAPFPLLQTRIEPEPTPVAPTVVTALPSATPTPAVVLPGAGSRGEGDLLWWPLAVVTGGAAAAIGAAAVVRRRR